MAEQSGVVDDMETAASGPNKKRGEAAPGTPFVLVALTYLCLRAVVCTAAAVRWQLDVSITDSAKSAVMNSEVGFGSPTTQT